MKLFKLQKNIVKLFVSVFFFAIVFVSPLWANEYKVNHADIKIAINPDKAFVKGAAEIDVVFPFREQKLPFLGLWKGLNADNVLLLEQGNWRRLVFSKKGILLTFPTLKPGRARLKIEFSGTLPTAGTDKEETVTGQKLHGVTKTALTKDFGQLVVDDYWHPWVPRMQAPQDIKGSKLTVVMPENYEIVATGQLLSQKKDAGVKTSVWQIGSGLRAGGFSLFYSSHHTLIQKSISGKSIGVFIPKNYEKLAEKFISIVSKIIEHHSKAIFPYPYQSQTLVFSDLFPSRWGYGKYSETVVIASDYCQYFQSLSPEKANVSAVAFFAHEIGHHWFGILINNSPIMCFTEGMPETLAGLACRNILGEKAETIWRSRVINELTNFFNNGGKDFPLEKDLEEYAIDPEKDPNIFQGAKDLQVSKFPLFMFKAKRILGDRVFYKTLKTFSLKHVGIKHIKTSTDFIASLPETVTQKQKEAIAKLFAVKFESIEDLIKSLL